ncbi:sodium:proline symporter [Deltaproteobacteria bacterium]|nr:sodium:proline symporter [Deltaproteobacteria bacterium]
MNGLLVGFIFYLVLMIVIGVVAYIKTKDQEGMAGFMVGKRDFGPILTAFGVGTSLASGFAFIGLVGAAYLAGSVSLFQPIFVTAVELTLWVVMAKRVRNKSVETRSLTPVELLSKLKGDPHNLIKICGGILISGFMVIYLAAQFVSGAKASVVFGIDYNTAVWVSALLVMAYVFLGGITAVMWTDAIQGVMMLVAFVLLLGTVLIESGGFFATIDALTSIAPHMISVTGGKTGMVLALSMITWISISFGFFGPPTGIQKFFLIKDEKSIPRAAVYSIGFNLVRQYIPLIIGLCGRVMFQNMADPEMLVPTIISTYFPSFLGGLLLASIFAAIMSTTDSLILQSTGEFTRSVLQLSLAPNLSDKTIVWITRFLTLVISCLGIYVALYGGFTNFTLTNFAFGGLSTSLAPALFLGFLYKKCTSWGILAGILSGIPSTAFWYYYMKASTGLHETIVGTTVAVLAVFIISNLTYGENKVKA